MRARVCCKKKKKKNKKNAGSAFAANYTFAKNPHEIMAPSLPPFHFSGKIGEAIFYLSRLSKWRHSRKIAHFKLARNFYINYRFDDISERY